MTTTYSIFAKDPSTGAGVTGLTVTWVGVYKVDTGAAVSPQPAFTEIGAGFYRFTVDAATVGSICGTIDLSASVSGAGRYLNVVISANNAGIQSFMSDRIPAPAAGGGGAGTGTVTSVAMTVPAEFSVAGSPVTTSGTLAVTKANQTANIVFSGPSSGGAAAPTFRTLVSDDIPSLAESKITNLVTDLAAKAPLASPTFPGVVVMPAHYGTITADSDGATITFDMAVSDKHSVTLGGNRTLAVTNDQTGQVFTLILSQDGTPPRTVTWWSGISWSGGFAPNLSTVANKTDVLTFIKTGAGAYLGALSMTGC